MLMRQQGATVLGDYFPDIRVIISAGTEPQSVAIAELLAWGNRWEPELRSIPVSSPKD